VELLGSLGYLGYQVCLGDPAYLVYPFGRVHRGYSNPRIDQLAF
jgi:hypothetical protein